MAQWWLEVNDCPSKEDHWRAADLLFPLEDRQAARSRVAALPGGPELLAFEREVQEGESVEPVSLRGYVAGV